MQVRQLPAVRVQAVLAGIGVGGVGRQGHRGHHAELLLHLLLVHPGALDGLGHPAAALLLKALEVLLHLVVDGLGVVEQDLIALLAQGRRVAVHAVLVDGLQLYAVVDVLLALVKVGHLLPAEQPPALLLFLFAPLCFRLGLRLGLLYHVLGARVLRHILRLRLVLLLWLGLRLIVRKGLGLVPGILFLLIPVLRILLLGGRLGSSLFGLALLALLLQYIFQCKSVITVSHGLLLSQAALCRTAS